MLFRVLIWVHVLAAIALLGPTFLFPALMKTRGDYPTVLRVGAAINRSTTAFLVVALLSGDWLIGVSPVTKDGGFTDARWLHLAMFLFFVSGGLHGVASMRLKKALGASEGGDDEAARGLLEPVAKLFGPMFAGLTAAIVYLMLNKPF